MDSSGEISLLCRLCLVKEQVNVPIFGENGDIRQIFLKISSCLPVKVSKEDPLPKNICEGCSDKLDSLYTFWNTSRDAEKTLLSWLQQAQVDNADEAVSAISKQISAQSELVKEETELTQDVSIKEDNDETGAPPAKRARRTAAVKAQISISQEESEEEDDVDEVEPLTKVEDESDMSDNDGTDDQPLSTFVDMPGTSVDEEQAGPSGVGKEAADAPPSIYIIIDKVSVPQLQYPLDIPEPSLKHPDPDPPKHSKKRHLCNICGDLVTNLSKHSKRHQLTCDSCFKTFSSTELLNEHINEQHINEQHTLESPYSCGTCNAPCASLLKLVVHKKVHLEKYQCPLCGFESSAKTLGPIRQHLDRHEDNFKERCQICQKGFMTKAALKNHLEIHAGVSKYQCQICQKKFTVKSYLKLHERFNHENSGLYQCEVCGRSFTFEKSLQRHLSTIHKIGKDLSVECEVCGKVIANNHNLNKHMRIHTGEKNYACDKCGKRFSQRKYVLRHQKVHLKEVEGESN